MFVFLGFLNKNGEEYDKCRDKQSKYCKVLDTSDNVVEVISDYKLRKLCKSNNLHVVFYNTGHTWFQPSKEGYTDFLSYYGYNYSHGTFFDYNARLTFEGCADNYFCFNYSTDRYGRMGHLIFTYNDIKVLSEYLDLSFVYWDETFIERCILPKIKSLYANIKLFGNCVLSDCLQDSYFRNSTCLKPYVDLIVFVFSNQQDLEVSYKYLCKHLSESAVLKIKKWYKFQDWGYGEKLTGEDKGLCYVTAESDGHDKYSNKVHRLLLDANRRNYIIGNNDFYALEVWYSAKMIYRKKFLHYTFSDIAAGKFRTVRF